MPYSHPQALTREQALGRMRHLLPGALAFSALAGFINSIALAYFHSPVSHMTGAVSYLGIDLAGERVSDVAQTLAIIFAFVIGAALAGFIVGARELSPGPRYGAALAVEGALLLGAMALLLNRHRFGVPLISMACGLQNATTSSYCGLMIRTTHVTGTVTDIGAMLGHMLRHRHVERRKLWFMIGTVAAFAGGVWVGALADQKWGPGCLTFAAVGCLVGGSMIGLVPRWFKEDGQTGAK